MEEDFVTYEQSLELTELGFNKPCYGYFCKDALGKVVLFSCELGGEKESCSIRRKQFICSAPLKQQVFKWFRDKYKIIVFPDPVFDFSSYTVTILQSDTYGHVRGKECVTYDETESKCIDELIKMVKSI